MRARGIGWALGAAIALGVCTAGSPLVWAGRMEDAFVTVDVAARMASGSLGSAHAGPGSQEIGCTALLIPSPAGSDRLLWCFAIASSGQAGSCMLSYAYRNSAGIEIIPALTEDAYLSFSWNASGLCTRLRVENYSYYAPVLP